MESVSLWTVDVIKAGPRAVLGALNAFHYHAVRNDTIILSGTVNRPRRRDGGVTASIPAFSLRAFSVTPLAVHKSGYAQLGWIQEMHGSKLPI